MEFFVANVDHIEFKIERDLADQVGSQLLPFPGMDKSTAAICLFYNSINGAECDKDRCPFRHVRADRTIVCKHWLRGLCKKGDLCEFLHEYDMTKMPECYFYSRFNACHNKECPFLHIDPESKIKDCPWYDRGWFFFLSIAGSFWY
jgi:cleavage and polyadenylation specificity factor subunit 4